MLLQDTKNEWKNYHQEACVCRALFKHNELLCYRGELVQHPAKILSWYFGCRDSSEMCSVTELNAAIPIKCVPFNRTDAIWVVDYEKLFEVGLQRSVVV